MFELKPLSQDAIHAALDKAMRYRLLNEPGAAESICLDVLQIDPANQQALVTLLLAMTDRLAKGYSVGDTQIQEVLGRLSDEYDRTYYTGIVWERRAKARLAKGSPGANYAAYDWFREAMEWFEIEELRSMTPDERFEHAAALMETAHYMGWAEALAAEDASVWCWTDHN